MIFFHLSHTDLDGYGCQLISKKIFPDGYYFNANYGLEVKTKLKKILQTISNFKEEDIFFLISDLNLNKDEAKKLNKEINYLNKEGFNITLKLLDHHISGKDCANKYDWYYLDETKSATKIVYEYFQTQYKQFDNLCEKGFGSLIEAINAVDIWLEDDKYFEYGKVLLTMIAKSYEINDTLFSDNNRSYRLNLLKEAIKYVDISNGHIKLDEMIYHLKKDYLKLENQTDTMDNLSSKYLVKLLSDKKDDLTIYYKGHKGLLTFTLGNISILANQFLKANSDYDFFMDVSRRGKASMRANGKLDVAQLANKIANGGGHPNASGMAFDDWKDIIEYELVKNYIEEKLKCYKL
jgi:oligoribonuclease NrnB/cAMP/cGMP phosphodiesterase (DHH superfamily)